MFGSRILRRIEAVLRLHTTMLEKLMAEEDDLKQAIADNATAMKDAATQIINDVAALADAHKTGMPLSDVEDLANQLKANTAQFRLAVSNAVNPQPAPAQNTGGAANPLPPADQLPQGTDPNKPVDQPQPAA